MWPCQAKTSWGRERVRGDVSCAVGCSAPAQTCSCSCSSLAGLSPPEAAQHGFVPADVQFRIFSTVTPNCYQILGNQQTIAAREAVLHAGIAETGGSWTCFRQISAETELGVTRQELVLPSRRMVSFCLFQCHSGLSPVCARPGHDLNWPSGLSRKGVSKAAAKPAAKPPRPPSPCPAWSRGRQVEKQHLPPGPRGALGQRQNGRQQAGAPWEMGISPSST